METALLHQYRGHMEFQYPYSKCKVTKTKKLWSFLFGEVLSLVPPVTNALPTTIKAFTAKHVLSNNRAFKVLHREE